MGLCGTGVAHIEHIELVEALLERGEYRMTQVVSEDENDDYQQRRQVKECCQEEFAFGSLLLQTLKQQLELAMVSLCLRQVLQMLLLPRVLSLLTTVFTF